MTRTKIEGYHSADESGYIPDFSQIHKTYTNTKSGAIYIIDGFGFNTRTQRWEYQYRNMLGLVFHREPASFHQIDTDDKPKFVEISSPFFGNADVAFTERGSGIYSIKDAVVVGITEDGKAKIALGLDSRSPMSENKTET